jgi:hypothetical protein
MVKPLTWANSDHLSPIAQRPGRYAQGGDKYSLFTSILRKKEAGDFVIEEGQARGAPAQGIGAEVELSADDAGFHLNQAVSAVAIASQYGFQIGDIKQRGAGCPAQRLVQAQVGGVLPKISRSDQDELVLTGLVAVSSGWQALYSVDIEVQIIEESAF